MEVLGIQPSTSYTTVHTNIPSKTAEHGQGTDTHLALGAAFHEYAIDWGPERIDWYFDRKLIYSQPTPPDLKRALLYHRKPWRGQASGAGRLMPRLIFQLQRKWPYVRAWQRPEYLGR